MKKQLISALASITNKTSELLDDLAIERVRQQEATKTKKQREQESKIAQLTKELDRHKRQIESEEVTVPKFRGE